MIASSSGKTNRISPRVVMLVSLGIVGIAIIAGLWLAFGRNARGPEPTPLAVHEKSDLSPGLPQPLYDFDVTQFKAMFLINSIDLQNRTMSLSYIYPAKWQDDVITSKIACDAAHTALYMNTPGVLASSTKPWYEEPRIKQGGIMQAICSDEFCKTITQYCEFVIE